MQENIFSELTKEEILNTNGGFFMLPPTTTFSPVYSWIKKEASDFISGFSDGFSKG